MLNDFEKEFLNTINKLYDDAKEKIMLRIKSENIPEECFNIVFGALFVGVDKFVNKDISEGAKKIIDIIHEELNVGADNIKKFVEDSKNGD